MVKVLDEVSLSVCQGDFIAITGESGSGKSTLLNIIGLLMPPSSGVVSYQGRPVSFGRGAEVAQRAAGRPIGFVFQQFNLIPYTIHNFDGLDASGKFWIRHRISGGTYPAISSALDTVTVMHQ